MDFWICHPLESEDKGVTLVPAFWPCADKMEAYLLDLAGHPKGRGIRPHILKVTTTPPPITIEIAKGRAELSQLAIQDNYREVATRDMDGIYARNVEQKHLPVPNSPILHYMLTRYRGISKTAHLPFLRSHVEMIAKRQN